MARRQHLTLFAWLYSANEEISMLELKHFCVGDSETDILAAVAADGAVILDDMMSDELADRIASETMPYIEASPPGNELFTGALTTRTGALIARSEGCQRLAADAKILSLVNTFLSPFCEKIQLHLSQMIRIKPGQPRQVLHRDRQAWGEFIPPSIEPQLNTIWALTDFSFENGATQVVPGSQLWDYSRKAMDNEVTCAAMTRGSVLLYSGSVIHGGGENQSGADRIGINLTYSLGWLRQEENQFLSCPPDVAKDLNPELQALLGYTMGSVACGYFSELGEPGKARELCPPEFAVGSKPAKGAGIIDQF
jgi:hypothetical protein